MRESPFIAGGTPNPTVLEVNGWVANAGTRAERVLVAAAGLKALPQIMWTC